MLIVDKNFDLHIPSSVQDGFYIYTLFIVMSKKPFTIIPAHVKDWEIPGGEQIRLVPSSFKGFFVMHPHSVFGTPPPFPKLTVS